MCTSITLVPRIASESMDGWSQLRSLVQWDATISASLPGTISAPASIPASIAATGLHVPPRGKVELGRIADSMLLLHMVDIGIFLPAHAHARRR